jgi:N-acetyl-gamma-glutamyl-phosphate reductase
MIRIGIVGGAGYTAGELIRILLHHPQAEIVWIHSKSQAGKKISIVHTDLVGDTNLTFTNVLDFQNIDVLFLCVGHQEAKPFIQQNNIPPTLRIIDLSQDFRIMDSSHEFVYGLPELNRENIQKAIRVANPGCFATAIQLALLPLAEDYKLQQAIHIQGITGSTGAGQALSDSTHFSWRNNNVSVYKAFNHQHQAEIKQSLRILQEDFHQELHFIPVRGNFTRGILVSAYLSVKEDIEYFQNLYHTFYQGHPFTIIIQENPDLKQVVNTNKAIIYLEKHQDQLLIICCIDNLLKGASGQAVQNMNLLFGLNETMGLQLKGSAF